jgi:integrase
MNNNHPKRGQAIKVEPIKSPKDIKTIKEQLRPNPLYFCLFILGINTNLRASDLLNITVAQVRHLKDMGEITIIEKKTKKERRISLNRACVQAIKNLLASRQCQDTDMLFIGQRGPLTVPSVSRLVKSWCTSIHLKGNYAAHTLRKTFGYQQRVAFGVGLPELMECFNHTSQKITLKYLCVQPEEIKNIYAHEI